MVRCGAVLAGTVAMVVEEGRGEGWLSQAGRYLGCERKYMWEAQLVLTISVGLAGTRSRSLSFVSLVSFYICLNSSEM